ncbi:MAG TPA: hypothetical protein VGM90_30775 [Kofleriaceae bacterium]|jgi:hypothetical protein
MSNTKELENLLQTAAELSAREDISSEVFMAAAWSAYLTARPGLREELEEKELKTQLRKLRKQGLIATA